MQICLFCVDMNNHINSMFIHTNHSSHLLHRERTLLTLFEMKDLLSFTAEEMVNNQVI